MAIVIETSYTTGKTLGGAWKRPDGLYFDYSDGTFKGSPTTRWANWVEGTGDLAGSYTLTVSSPSVPQWPDGNYTLLVRASDQSNAVVANALIPIRDQTTGTVVPPTATEILTTVMPEDYAANGDEATLAQMLYMQWARQANIEIGVTTVTGKQLDGSTTAFVIAANNPTNTTSFKRSS